MEKGIAFLKESVRAESYSQDGHIKVFREYLKYVAFLESRHITATSILNRSSNFLKELKDNFQINSVGFSRNEILVDPHFLNMSKEMRDHLENMFFRPKKQ